LASIAEVLIKVKVINIKTVRADYFFMVFKVRNKKGKPVFSEMIFYG